MKHWYAYRMIGLLTWTTYGTWLAGPARGWIDPGDVLEPADPLDLPGPDEKVSALRRKSLRWPAACLDVQQRQLVVDDLHRIAELRGFKLLGASAGEHCIRVLLSFDDDRDTHRLVQLIKGALSRMLTVAAGDAPASATDGSELVHHKWWPRQYSLLRIDDEVVRRAVLEALRAGAHTGAAVWIAGNSGA